MWQTIDSAPKKGEFLVCGGTWVGEIGGEYPYTIAHVDDVFCVQNTDYYSAHIDNPTHWMPLPEGPK